MDIQHNVLLVESLWNADFLFTNRIQRSRAVYCILHTVYNKYVVWNWNTSAIKKKKKEKKKDATKAALWEVQDEVFCS